MEDPEQRTEREHVRNYDYRYFLNNNRDVLLCKQRFV